MTAFQVAGGQVSPSEGEMPLPTRSRLCAGSVGLLAGGVRESASHPCRCWPRLSSGRTGRQRQATVARGGGRFSIRAFARGASQAISEIKRDTGDELLSVVTSATPRARSGPHRLDRYPARVPTWCVVVTPEIRSPVASNATAKAISV